MNQELSLDSKFLWDSITGFGLIADNIALLFCQWELENFLDIHERQKVNCVHHGGNKVPLVYSGPNQIFTLKL